MQLSELLIQLLIVLNDCVRLLLFGQRHGDRARSNRASTCLVFSTLAIFAILLLFLRYRFHRWLACEKRLFGLIGLGCIIDFMTCRSLQLISLRLVHGLLLCGSHRCLLLLLLTCPRGGWPLAFG